MLLSNKRNLGLDLEVLMGFFSLFFGGTEGLRGFFLFCCYWWCCFGKGEGFFPLLFLIKLTYKR